MKAADMIPFEQVQIYNLTNGERFATYLIKAEKDSGTVGVNGAAAHKARAGDQLIIVSYAMMKEKECDFFLPQIVLLDKDNRIKKQT